MSNSVISDSIGVARVPASVAKQKVVSGGARVPANTRREVVSGGARVPANTRREVVFGGVRVPANTRREVINQDGKEIYCVWLNNEGAKITYPEQQQISSNTSYKKVRKSSSGLGKRSSIDITAVEFYTAYEKAKLDRKNFVERKTRLGDHEILSVKDRSEKSSGDVIWYEKTFDSGSSKQPRIDVEIGSYHDTYEICNIEKAILEGSPKGEFIRLKNTSDCSLNIKDGDKDYDVVYDTGKNTKIVAADEKDRISN